MYLYVRKDLVQMHMEVSRILKM